MIRIIGIVFILAGLAAVAVGFAAWTLPGHVSADPLAPTVAETQIAAPAAEAVAPPSLPGDITVPSLSSDVQPAGTVVEGGGNAAQLRDVPVAHETPASASFGRAFDVTLALDATAAADPAAVLVGGNAVREGVAVIGGDARANLVGTAFAIEALSPPDQVVSEISPNVWRWKVTPLSSGSHDLVIEIFALQNGRALPVRSFRDTVTVEVSTLRQAIDFATFANPLFMVLGGIGSVLGGAFTALRFFSKATGRG